MAIFWWTEAVVQDGIQLTSTKQGRKYKSATQWKSTSHKHTEL